MLAVRAECGEDNLNFVAHALGEEGAKRAVHQAAEENPLFAGPAFAAEEVAWDASSGVEFFFKVDGQRKEVDSRPHSSIHRGSGKDNGVAATDGDCAAGLLGKNTGLNA